MEKGYIYKVEYYAFKIEDMNRPESLRPILARGPWYTDKPLDEIVSSLREFVGKDYEGEYAISIDKIKRIEGHL